MDGTWTWLVASMVSTGVLVCAAYVSGFMAGRDDAEAERRMHAKTALGAPRMHLPGAAGAESGGAPDGDGESLSAEVESFLRASRWVG